jgi:hypothetical protein
MCAHVGLTKVIRKVCSIHCRKKPNWTIGQRYCSGEGCPLSERRGVVSFPIKLSPPSNWLLGTPSVMMMAMMDDTSVLAELNILVLVVGVTTL